MQGKRTGSHRDGKELKGYRCVSSLKAGLQHFRANSSRMCVFNLMAMAQVAATHNTASEWRPVNL